MSSSCTQSIKHTCTVNSLTSFASWVGRDGIVRKYWSGNGHDHDTGCQCSVDRNCERISNLKLICNCDSRGVNVIDDGILSDKMSLPVMSLRYGGSVTGVSKIQYVLGPLLCSGKAQPYPSEIVEIERNNLKENLSILSNKVKNIEKRKEPVVAFRVIQVETDEVEIWKLDRLFLNIKPGLLAKHSFDCCKYNE